MSDIDSADMTNDYIDELHEEIDNLRALLADLYHCAASDDWEYDRISGQHDDLLARVRAAIEEATP